MGIGPLVDDVAGLGAAGAEDVDHFLKPGDLVGELAFDVLGILADPEGRGVDPYQRSAFLPVNAVAASALAGVLSESGGQSARSVRPCP